MRDPFRDPFLRPGVADEIEAQLRMQEERRVEAGRLAKAEAEISGLRLNMRRGIWALTVLAIGISLVVAAFFADLYQRRPASPVDPAPTAFSLDSPRISRASPVSSSKSRLLPTTRKAENTMQAGAAPARMGSDLINTAPASDPPIPVAPSSDPSLLATPTPAMADAENGKAVAPVSLSSIGWPSREYEIKAAYLYHFAQFVNWPSGAFSAADSPFTIGILGDDPFGGVIDQVFTGARIHGRKFAIKRSRAPADLHDVQMVFIGKSERSRIQEILRSFAGTNTLTVGETNGFKAMGGMIELTFVDSTIRFRTNSLAAEKAGLGISPNLLKLAVP